MLCVASYKGRIWGQILVLLWGHLVWGHLVWGPSDIFWQSLVSKKTARGVCNDSPAGWPHFRFRKICCACVRWSISSKSVGAKKLKEHYIIISRHASEKLAALIDLRSEKMTSSIVVLSVLCVVGPLAVWARSGGAPAQACANIAPDPNQHGAQPSTDDNPYYLNISTLPQIPSGGYGYQPGYSYTRKSKRCPLAFR